MALSLERKIVWFAVISRLSVFCLQVIFNALIPDHNPDVFNPPLPDDQQLNYSKCGDDVAEIIIGGLRRWDGVYFMHIAEHGYTYQNCLVFFPLFPFVVRFLANSLMWPLQWVVSYRYVLLTSAVLVNGYCFVMASVMLYRLGTKVLNNDKLAYKAALLFSINPASIFMTAPYSEAMFVYLTFRGLWQFEQTKSFRSSVRLGIAAVVRSNGLTNFGFIYYDRLKRLILQLYEIKRTHYMNWSSVRAIVSGVLCIELTPILLSTVIMFLPFLTWQYLAYSMYCYTHSSNKDGITVPDYLAAYGRLRKYVVQGDPPPLWCQSYLPFSYSYIQSSHWGVGLFQYYEFKQLPNFLMASPVVFLCFSMVWCYVRKNPVHCLTLGFNDGVTTSKKTDLPIQEYGLFGAAMLVYVAHMVFLATFGILFMHVQVLTRMIFSSTPLIYWFTAWLTSDTDVDTDTPTQVNHLDVMKNIAIQQRVESTTNLQSRLYNRVTDQLSQLIHCPLHTMLIYLYFFSYAVIGTAFFSNFLPWT